MNRCPQCGHNLVAGADFCTGCGARLAEKAKVPHQVGWCRQCSGPLFEGEDFCTRCATAKDSQVGWCELCHRELPWKALKRFEFNGMECYVIWFRWKSWSAELCRSCAGKFHAHVQWDTLTHGIWGVPGVAASPVLMLMNLGEYTYGVLTLPQQVEEVAAGNQPTQQLEQDATCLSCGAKLHKNARYCEQCGLRQ